MKQPKREAKSPINKILFFNLTNMEDMFNSNSVLRTLDTHEVCDELNVFVSVLGSGVPAHQEIKTYFKNPWQLA